jgi:hypothetical protein
LNVNLSEFSWAVGWTGFALFTGAFHLLVLTRAEVRDLFRSCETPPQIDEDTLSQLARESSEGFKPDPGMRDSQDRRTYPDASADRPRE